MNDDSLSGSFKAELEFALNEMQQTSDHIARIEAQLRAYVEQTEDCQILCSTPGIGGNQCIRTRLQIRKRGTV
jgi:transposase